MWPATSTGLVIEDNVTNFRMLDDGTYRLREIAPPPGYDTIPDLIFTVNAEHDTDASSTTDGILKVTKLEAVFEDTDTIKLGTVTGNVDNGIISIVVQDPGGLKLPETGGMGTILLYAAGGLVILVAVAGLAYSLRKRESSNC